MIHLFRLIIPKNNEEHYEMIKKKLVNQTINSLNS